MARSKNCFVRMLIRSNVQEILPIERSLEPLKTLDNLLHNYLKKFNKVQEVTLILWIKNDLPTVIKVLVDTA